MTPRSTAEIEFEIQEATPTRTSLADLEWHPGDETVCETLERLLGYALTDIGRPVPGESAIFASPGVTDGIEAAIADLDAWEQSL